MTAVSLKGMTCHGVSTGFVTLPLGSLLYERKRTASVCVVATVPVQFERRFWNPSRGTVVAEK